MFNNILYDSIKKYNKSKYIGVILSNRNTNLFMLERYINSQQYIDAVDMEYIALNRNLTDEFVMKYKHIFECKYILYRNKNISLEILNKLCDPDNNSTNNLEKRYILLNIHSNINTIAKYKDNFCIDFMFRNVSFTKVTVNELFNLYKTDIFDQGKIRNNIDINHILKNTTINKTVLIDLINIYYIHTDYFKTKPILYNTSTLKEILIYIKIIFEKSGHEFIYDNLPPEYSDIEIYINELNILNKRPIENVKYHRIFLENRYINEIYKKYGPKRDMVQNKHLNMEYIEDILKCQVASLYQLSKNPNLNLKLIEKYDLYEHYDGNLYENKFNACKTVLNRLKKEYMNALYLEILEVIAKKQYIKFKPILDCCFIELKLIFNDIKNNQLKNPKLLKFKKLDKSF